MGVSADNAVTANALGNLPIEIGDILTPTPALPRQGGGRLMGKSGGG